MKRDLVSRISFSNSFSYEASDSEGASGGVLTLYNSRAFKLTPLFSSSNALLCKVFHFQSNDSWLILNLYAPNTKKERNCFWIKLLGILSKCILIKGIIMGDFNSPLSDADKMGGHAPDQDSKRDLALFIQHLAFLDLDLQGGSFTWSNRRIGGDSIQVHLDRGLISPDWLLTHSCRLSLLPRVGSDHSPISLSVSPLSRNKAFPFHFEKMWLSHPALEGNISHWWSIEVEGTAMYRVAQKLKNVKRNIKSWNRTDFGDIFQEKDEITDRLSLIQDDIQHSGYNELNSQQERAILSDLHNIISKE